MSTNEQGLEYSGLLFWDILGNLSEVFTWKCSILLLAQNIPYFSGMPWTHGTQANDSPWSLSSLLSWKISFCYCLVFLSLFRARPLKGKSDALFSFPPILFILPLAAKWSPPLLLCCNFAWKSFIISFLPNKLDTFQYWLFAFTFCIWPSVLFPLLPTHSPS